MTRALLVAVVLAIAGATAAPAHAAFHFRERSRSVTQGSLRAEIDFKYDRASKFWQDGRLRIWNRSRLIVNDHRKYEYSGAFTLPTVAIRQLDGTGPPEVLLTVYSGGAHCCWESVIYTGAHRTAKQWGHIEAPALRDVDGDGKPEFHGFDTGFAYAFGSFAASRFPAKVWAYFDGAVHDVSSAYPAEIQADEADQYAAYQTAAAAGSTEGVRCALAAYAADGYTLGQGDAAMAVVQQAVDAGQTGDGATDAFGTELGDFVPALNKVLIAGGYEKAAG